MRVIWTRVEHEFDTIFDFPGNFGGAMELVLLSLTIATVCLEDMLKANRLKRVCIEQLSLGKVVNDQKARQKQMAKKQIGGCCKKKGVSVLDEYIDEAVEDDLSFQSLVKVGVVTKLLKDTLLPDEVTLFAPIYYSIVKAKEAKKEEEEKELRKKNKKVTVSPLSEKVFKDSTEDDQMSIKEAIAKLMSPQFEVNNPALAPLKKMMKVMSEIEEQTQGFSKVGEVEFVSYSGLTMKKSALGESITTPLKSNKLATGEINEVEMSAKPVKNSVL